MKSNIFLVLIACLSFNSLDAQILINEYSASNLNSFLDEFNKTEDWIELYNTSGQAVDISGWHLSDKADKPTKWAIPEGTVIEGNGFLVFWCSGRDRSGNGNFHTNFKLAQTTGKDILLLSNPAGAIINQFDLELTLVEHSRCRTTDGGDDWAICTFPSLGSSNDSRPQFSKYTAKPTMNLLAGFHNGQQTISLINNEPNTILRYTLDGTNPTASSLIYSEPITITKTTVIKTSAFSDDPSFLTGKMDFNTYFIDEDFTLAVFSVAADQVLELAGGAGNLIPIGSLEYFNVNKEREAIGFGSLNRHGQDSWALDHRSLDWVTRDEMGYKKAIDAKLFTSSDRDEYQKFMFRNSGDDNYPAINDFAHQGSTHIRDEYVQTLSREGDMALDTRRVERVIVFLNGQYWGVYGMRERPVDHDYTGEYYDQGKYDINYLSTWGTTEAEYGGQRAFDDWFEIRDFILDNDMGVKENYEYVKSKINLKSLCDYFIANLNVVAKDWLNYNTGWWRGLDPEGDHKKWGYILWDLDATFDYYINYTDIPNENADAEPCDIDDISISMDNFFGIDDNGGGMDIDPSTCPTVLNGAAPYPPEDSIFAIVINQDPFCCNDDWDAICQNTYDDLLLGGNGGPGIDPGELFGNIGKHEKLFIKLQEESAVFRQYYYSRQADLMNTVYTCENMNATLDRMLDVIRPEMPRQIERWGGSMQEWNNNVENLYDFVNERCTLLDDGMVDCFSLTGPYELTLIAEPAGIGEIDFNTLDVEDMPWTGEYFGGMPNLIHANVFNEFEPTWKFDHWETSNGSIILPDVFNIDAELMINGPDTLKAVFSLISSVEENLLDKLQFQAYPNPAYDQIAIQYELTEAKEMSFELYSMMGQR